MAGGELCCGGGCGKKEGERCEQEREPRWRGGAQREEKVQRDEKNLREMSEREEEKN